MQALKSINSKLLLIILLVAMLLIFLGIGILDIFFHFPIMFYIRQYGVIVIAAVVVVVVYILLKRKSKPLVLTQLRISAEPTEIVADGKTKSLITVQLIDDKRKPIAALADIQVKIKATNGTIENPIVTIPKGKDMEKTVLTSAKESGEVALSAEAKGFERTDTIVHFTEKPRFCMGCGNRKKTMGKCKNCGATAAQFVGPAKICKNCEFNGKKTYLPATAQFCSECGASQPK